MTDILTNTNSFTELEDLLTEHSIKMQFVAGTQPLANETLELNIKDDITLLTQLYLNAKTKLKLAFPSINVDTYYY